MKLFGSETSPYVRKVRVYLEETETKYDFVGVDAWKPGSDLLNIAPIGKVPVLIRDNAEALYESNLIIEYLESSLPDDKRLTPAAGERRWQILRLQALASGMIDATATRTVESRKPEQARSPVVLDRELGRIDRVLAMFEQTAGAGQLTPAGGKLTTADLVLGVALQYLDFRHTPEWRNSAPRLAAWLAPIAHRPAFTRTLPPGFVSPG